MKGKSWRAVRGSDCRPGWPGEFSQEEIYCLATVTIMFVLLNKVENCAICSEDTHVDQMFSVDTCRHRFCFSCMKTHAAVKVLEGVLQPMCPHERCKTKLKMEACKKLLTSELFDIMSQRLKEASIPAADKVYCPFPKCSTLMSKAEIQGHASSSSCQSDSVARKCTKCHAIFCIYCKVPWHNSMSCSNYRKVHPHHFEAEEKLKSLASRNLWRQCLNCNHMVSLDRGCYHIYCRCGHEFCYNCGAQWVKKNPTCKCPIWDERNIIYN